MVAGVDTYFVSAGPGPMIEGFLQGVRVTVAGATGFIGNNLLPELVAAGAKVRGITTSNTLGQECIGVDFMQADLTTADGCRTAAEGTDIFIMAAAKSSGAHVMASAPLTHLTPNVVMNALTMEAAYQAGVSKYCFISSNTVYPPGEKAMTETDVTGDYFESYKVVGGMKHYSEQMLEHFSSLGDSRMNTLVIRPANLYGPFDKFTPGESKVVPALVRRAVMKEDPFLVWGDGRDVKDFLYISDFVSGLVKSLSLDIRHETLNLSSGKSVSLREILPSVLRNAGHESAKVEFDLSRPSMIPVRRIDNRRASELLDWTPLVGIDEGISRTVEWFRSNQPGHR